MAVGPAAVGRSAGHRGAGADSRNQRRVPVPVREFAVLRRWLFAFMPEGHLASQYFVDEIDASLDVTAQTILPESSGISSADSKLALHHHHHHHHHQNIA